MPELRSFLSGGGDTAELIRAHDWASTPLGDIGSWPQSLRSALSICLRSATPSAIFWGADHLFLYNDAWASMLADRHPSSLGMPARKVLSDIWQTLQPQFRTVVDKAEAVNRVDTLLVRNLGGATFDSYWSYSMLPVASEDGTIGGVLAQARNTTERIMRGRRDALMLRLSDRLRLISDEDELLAAAVEMVGEEMDVGRIGYAEANEERGVISILRCAVRHGMSDSSGEFPIPKFGDSINDDLHAGRVIRIEDKAKDKRLADPGVRWRYDAMGVESALVVPVVSGARCQAMLFAHHNETRAWTAHEEALLRQATEQIWRELSRARAETALRGSEQRYRRIFEQAHDLILTADLDQIITDINPAVAAAIEAPREEIIGRSIREFVSERGFEQTTRMLREKVEQGGTTHHGLDVVARSGRVMHWEVNSTLTRDKDGRPIGLHAIARDVTERRRAEERQRLLVNELNHRVKNTLALVQGLALQSFKQGRDLDEARAAFQDRLAALAAAHDMLTRENWEGATLAQLAQEAVGHHNAREERIMIEGPDLVLSPKAAVSLVMALHELGTNAAKYGALSAPSGRVTLGWRVADGERLRLEWRERGGPAVTAPGQRGFGFRMIERALASDLAGSARIAFEPEGLVCGIDAPLAEAAPRAAA
ncbi:MAG TPA: HWE histidine kinase domain-containing protein [Allosphingosinicella sp.]